MGAIFRSSHQSYSIKIGVLRNFTKFTGKYLYQRLCLCPRPPTLLKKSLWHRWFLVNFAKFLRTSFLKNTSQWELLDFSEKREKIVQNLTKSWKTVVIPWDNWAVCTKVVLCPIHNSYFSKCFYFINSGVFWSFRVCREGKS